MLVIVAPDSFKGTASATTAARAIAQGMKKFLSESPASAETIEIVEVPMADGGEGTAELLARHVGGAEVIELPTTDAYGRLTTARYYRKGDTAFIDVAAASGLPAGELGDVKLADTYGTGVLIADAESRGVTHIFLGMGGSATIDGGTGILAALGAAGLDERGYALPKGGAALVRLHDIDTAQLNIKAGALNYTLLADTKCPPHQAPAMYGPQKGARGEDVALLTGALLQLCEVTGIDPSRRYFGAAGGLPIALTWLSTTLWGSEEHIEVTPGAKHLVETFRLRERITDYLAQAPDAQVVLVTGEGRFDEQSTTGKVVGTLADLAADTGATLAIVAGSIDKPALEALEASLHTSPTDSPQESAAGTDASRVLAVELSSAEDVTAQLEQAGRDLAAQLLG